MLVQEKEAKKSSSVAWRFLQDTQGTQYRLKIVDPVPEGSAKGLKVPESP